MKIRKIGDETLVTISSSEVWRWTRRWPCATITHGVWARFAKNGDLVDTNAPEDVDGREFDALFSDAIASEIPDHPAIRGETEPWIA